MQELDQEFGQHRQRPQGESLPHRQRPGLSAQILSSI
jgi:hypothetical protein